MCPHVFPCSIPLFKEEKCVNLGSFIFEMWRSFVVPSFPGLLPCSCSSLCPYSVLGGSLSRHKFKTETKQQQIKWIPWFAPKPLSDRVILPFRLQTVKWGFQKREQSFHKEIEALLSYSKRMKGAEDTSSLALSLNHLSHIGSVLQSLSQRNFDGIAEVVLKWMSLFKWWSGTFANWP